MHNASLVKKLYPRYPGGDARLFQLNHPISYYVEGTEKRSGPKPIKTNYVVVIAVFVEFGEQDTGPETNIFPANKQGDVLDWFPLKGSIKGILDHERVLLEAGYFINETHSNKRSLRKHPGENSASST